MRLSGVFVKINKGPDIGESVIADLPADADVLSKLERLAKLREQGVISDAEMERLKHDVLATE